LIKQEKRHGVRNENCSEDRNEHQQLFFRDIVFKFDWILEWKLPEDLNDKNREIVMKETNFSSWANFSKFPLHFLKNSLTWEFWPLKNSKVPV
jgi:hypothetical protein